MIENKPGIEIISTREILEEEAKRAVLEATEEIAARARADFEESLAGYILQEFERNKDARRNSGIEEEMLEAVRAYNGVYSPSELATLESEGGSTIFMNLTATKCRACASWMKDILLPSVGRAWEINPSVVEDIQPSLSKKIEDLLNEEFIKVDKEFEGSQQQQGVTPPAPSAVPQQQQKERPTGAASVATRLREMNKLRRDIHETIREEIRLIAKSEMADMEDMIEDQLTAGSWEKALSDFIDNFVVFPTAFLKGPVIRKKRYCTYKNGKIEDGERYIFENVAVNPFDMYPSGEATDINEGSLIEHIRLERKDLVAMKKLGEEGGFSITRINELLEENAVSPFVNWWITDIEEEKAELEMRGNSSDANTNILHGLEYYGPASVQMLKNWGYPEEELSSLEDTDEVEISAILVGNTVIKALINDDPEKRRPYFKASFQNRPGSYWGRSLPNLMRDIQRMCNATARDLANNMGLSSGPQVLVVIDRLADAGDITEIHPFKIWQTTTSPTGGSERAIDFMQPKSNAAELLTVYKEFELRADDATGIPRYAYGNERTGGAASTASGLSMLLESASKGIKAAIRHIDIGVIIPRIHYQFYWNLKTYGEELDYTGDIEVVAKGSSTLTIKAAEQGKRIEFLQAVSGNPQILEVLGVEGLAELFRAMLVDVNLNEIVIPSRLELREKEKERAKAMAEQANQAFALEQQKNNNGIEATKLQINGQTAMHRETMAVKREELNLKRAEIQNRGANQIEELQTKERIATSKNTVDAAKAMVEQEQANIRQNRELAFELAKNTNEGGV